MTNNRVYFINELERDKDGGFIPCIAVEGVTGYYRTDWNWGKDITIAQEIADEKNSALGFTPKQAFEIVLGTMRQPKKETKMVSYKQTVLDIKDYISFELASIENLLNGVTLTHPRRLELEAEKQALEDIADIIKENGK